MASNKIFVCYHLAGNFQKISNCFHIKAQMSPSASLNVKRFFQRVFQFIVFFAHLSGTYGYFFLLTGGNEKFFQMLIRHRLSGQTIIKCLDLLILIFQNSGEAGIFKNTECLFKIVPGNFYKFVQIPYHT